MANTFLTSTFVVNATKDAAILLSANMVAGNLLSRELEGFIAGGVPTVGPTGGTVTVKVIAADTANSQNHRVGLSSLSVTDVTETSVDIDALTYVYIKKRLDTKEKTFELDDFAKKYTAPAMVGLAMFADNFFINKMAGGFARYTSGTVGTPASTVSHILAARKVMQDNLIPPTPRVGLIGTTAEASFLALDQFVNRDYGEDGSTNLRAAALSTRYGINWFVDQNVGTFDEGYTTGTVLAKGAGTTADTSMIMDAFTTDGGTVNEGARFKVAGDTNEYIVTRLADINDTGDNEATIYMTPVVVTGWSDDAAVTWQTEHTEDMIFHPGMVAGAVIAPRPLMANSEVASFNGLSIRVSFESTTSDSTVGAADFVLYDFYIGCKVINPKGGVILQA